MSSEGTSSDRNHIQHVLITAGAGFQIQSSADDGIREALQTTRTGLISHPHDQRYRNARFIIQ